MVTGVLVLLAAVVFAIAGWEIYPRLLSRSQRLRTSPIQLFFQSLATAAIAGFGAAMFVVFVSPEERADNPVIATPVQPPPPVQVTPARPPVAKAQKPPVEPKSAANPTAGSSAQSASSSIEAVDSPKSEALTSTAEEIVTGRVSGSEQEQVFPTTSPY